MGLTAFTVSVNYSDFLAITLPKNKIHFDDYWIITSLEDEATVNLCKKLDIKCIQTDIFTYNGAVFNKGGAYNVALSIYKDNDWICILDSDIYLPDNFRQIFNEECNDIECLYSSQRIDFPKADDWREYLKDPSYIKKMRTYRGIGYGYLQIFNFRSMVVLHQLMKGFQQYVDVYPQGPTAAEGDWIFRNYWSDWIFDPPLDNNPDLHEKPHNDRAANPKKLKNLPLKVFHLGETGQNDKGRKTEKWEI